MTTKDRERAALEKIKGIVAGLGEGSYIAAALEGGFELAEENIENDFACTLRERWEGRVKAAEKKVSECVKENAALKDQIRSLEAGEQARSEAKQRTINEQAQYIDSLESRYQEKLDMIGKLTDEAAQARDTDADLRAQIESRDMEIMKLKARLFDLLVK